MKERGGGYKNLWITSSVFPAILAETGGGVAGVSAAVALAGGGLPHQVDDDLASHVALLVVPTSYV